MHLARKLAVGTAQFGFDYGIANRLGKVPLEEIVGILSRAYDSGIDTLDTAIGYVEAETEIGCAGVSKWRIISKIPAISTSINFRDVDKWIDTEVHNSLERLRATKLSGLMVHHAADLLGEYGDLIIKALVKLKSTGVAEKIGVSIYDFEELLEITKRFDIDIVQVPFNCLDRRLVDSGALNYLNQNGIDVHVRSIFLQGLLLMSPKSRPTYFKKWQPLWDIWDTWILERAIDPIAACLQLPLSYPNIDRIIVGVDSLNHLNQILRRVENQSPHPPDGIRCNDPDLINPSRWKL